MKQSGRKIAGALVATSLLLVAGSAFADGREDFYTQFNQQRFFNQQQNARTIGMAGSSVATSSDSSSVTGNPAGLGFMRDAEISATYARDTVSGNDDANFSEIQQDIDSGQVLGSFPIVPTLDGTPQYGSLGLGWSGAKSEVDDSADLDTKGYGLHVAYGKDISPDVAVGYGVSFIHDKATANIGGANISDEMDDGVRQELGAQIKTSKDDTVGLSAAYGFGTRDTQVNSEGSGNDEDVSSLQLEAGLGHQMGTTLLAASTDYTSYNTEEDDSYAWGFKVGVEEAITDAIKARLGYRYQANFSYDGGYGNDNAKYNAVAWGLGVKIAKNLSADYGGEFRSVGDGSDWLHAVTLSVPFSLCD